jgi:AcrR family transcriptional regulator
VPKLWSDTIEAHHRAVVDATLGATAALVAERGLRAVTMTTVAETAGIGRATLYKYFPDVDALLLAWHEREMTAHLDILAVAAGQAGAAGERLEKVLTAYALISRRTPNAHEHHGAHGHSDAELMAFLHGEAQMAPAQQQLRDMIGNLLAEAAQAGELRDDVPPAELASYCLHALSAASGLTSEQAVHRLVAVTLTGLQPKS